MAKYSEGLRRAYPANAAVSTKGNHTSCRIRLLPRRVAHEEPGSAPPHRRGMRTSCVVLQKPEPRWPIRGAVCPRISGVAVIQLLRSPSPRHCKGELTIHTLYATLLILLLLLTGCSRSNTSSHNATSALYSCIGRFDHNFRVEREEIYPKLQDAVQVGTRKPDDPTVAPNLKAISDQFNAIDPAVQATTCEPAAQDYQYTMQGISSGMRRAAAQYYDAFANRSNSQLAQATQQIATVNRLLKHAVDVAFPGGQSGGASPTSGR
jgi:hypothetical protein